MTTFSPQEFSDRLATAGKRLHPEVSRILNKAAKNVRDDWRSMAARQNPAHAKRYPGSIAATWARVSRDGVEASVAPKHGPQAKLGTVLELGGPRNAPQLSHLEAAAREIPAMNKWLAKAAEECL